MTLEALIKLVAAWIKEKKTGSIKVNFFKGGISTVNITETLKTK